MTKLLLWVNSINTQTLSVCINLDCSKESRTQSLYLHFIFKTLLRRSYKVKIESNYFHMHLRENSLMRDFAFDKIITVLMCGPVTPQLF